MLQSHHLQWFGLVFLTIFCLCSGSMTKYINFWKKALNCIFPSLTPSLGVIYSKLNCHRHMPTISIWNVFCNEKNKGWAKKITNAKPFHMNDENDTKTNDLCKCIKSDGTRMGLKMDGYTWCLDQTHDTGLCVHSRKKNSSTSHQTLFLSENDSNFFGYQKCVLSHRLHHTLKHIAKNLWKIKCNEN